MATLVSPGVSVTVTNESYFIPASAPTVPLIILATQQNKPQDPTNPSSPIAPGTQEYGVVRTITSLAQSQSTFGIPVFNTTNGQPNHGDSTNEYGLATLNAFLGIGDYAYTIRANVNLNNNFTDIQELWAYDITVAGSILENLVNQWIAQYNSNNNFTPQSPPYTPTSPGYRTTIDATSLFDLMQTATSFIWADTTFAGGTPTVKNDFFQDHSTSGIVYTLGTLTPGAAGTVNVAGTYFNVPLTGGTGTGAQGTVVVTGTGVNAVVSSVTISPTSPGSGYLVNDVLSFSGVGYGNVSHVTVASVSTAAFPVYTNGFSAPQTGTFLGMTGYMNYWIAHNLGSVVTTEWTSTEAVNTLIGQSDDFEWTQNFLFKTSLGTDDASRRAVIVTALNEIINSNEDIRAETIQYNLVLCPGYSECTSNLVSLVTTYLNSEVFVIGDTPMNVDPTGLSTWAGSSNRVIDTNGNVAYYYPHILTTNLDGSTILVPSSAWALRTYAYNDNVAYEWFAPAGLRRGIMTGLSDLGYVSPTSTLGTATQFVELYLNQGQRDVMYGYTATGSLNPLVFFPGNGFVIWGQKNSVGTTSSSLDRVNVSRLVKYIARSLRQNTLSFVFEPNDTLTQNNLKALVDNFLGDLITKRGLYDFATICDTSNNPPSVVQQNELYIDVAIQPVIAAEFIYIPITIVATGADLTSGGAVQSAQMV